MGHALATSSSDEPPRDGADACSVLDVVGGARNEIELMRQALEGLPFSAFESLRRLVGVSSEELGGVISIQPRTLTRRRKEGRLQPTESDRLVRAARIVAHAVRALGSKDRAVRWLKKANRSLGGAVPLRWLDNEIGSRQVDDALGRIEYGVFG